MLLTIPLALIAVGVAILWLGGTSVAGLDSVPLGLVVLMIGVLAGFVSIMFWTASGELEWRKGRRR